eukprot:1301213-Rhodomonas_salina.1
MKRTRVVAVSVVAEGGHDRLSELPVLVQRHKRVERNRKLTSGRHQQATNFDVPSHVAVGVLGRHVRDVVDVGMLIHVRRSNVAHVELARKVRQGRVSLAVVGQLLSELLRVRPRVDDLLRVDSGQRVSN